MFLVGVMKTYLRSFLDNGKRMGVGCLWVFLSHLFTKITTTISSSVINKTKDLRARAHTHTQSKMRIKAFRLGVLSSSNYSSEAPNYTVQNQLKRRQHYMEKLKQVGEEEAEGPLKSTST